MRAPHSSLLSASDNGCDVTYGCNSPQHLTHSARTLTLTSSARQSAGIRTFTQPPPSLVTRRNATNTWCQSMPACCCLFTPQCRPNPSCPTASSPPPAPARARGSPLWRAAMPAVLMAGGRGLASASLLLAVPAEYHKSIILVVVDASTLPYSPASCFPLARCFSSCLPWACLVLGPQPATHQQYTAPSNGNRSDG